MKRARRQVGISTLLLLVGLGAAITAAVRTTDWLILGAYLLGAIAAWYVFGSLVAYAQTRAKTQLARAGLTSVAADLQRAARDAKTAGTPAEPENR